MLKLRKVAITGNIASGKSKVCSYFKRLGAVVIDADKIAHKLLLKKELKKSLINIFGKECLKGSRINRDKIAKEVFDDRKKLKKLEKLLHPLLLLELEKLFEKAKNKKKLFVVELPLLFELNLEKGYDKIVLVVAEKEIRKKRFSKSDFEKRENQMIPISKKIKKADFTIENNSTLAHLKKQVNQINKEIISLWIKKK